MTIYEDLKGKHALITGAGIGIGKGIAEAFRDQGTNLLLHFYEPKMEQAGIASLMDTCKEKGILTYLVPGDFAEPQSATKIAQRAIEACGGVDIVINCAGITLDTALANVTEELFDRLYHVNVRAPLMISKAMAPHMKARGGGVIVNLSSIHGSGGIPGHPVYAGTKGAIDAMTRQLAVELGRDKIRVNAIAPAGVDVPRQLEVDPGYSPEKYGKLVPIGMISYPIDIANAALFLSSEASRCITGQILCVDGGATAVPGIGTLHSRDPNVPLERQPYLQ